MKNRACYRKQRHSQKRRKRKRSTLIGGLKALLVQIFEVWKSVPDSIKTTVLVSLAGILVAVFWAADRVPTVELPQEVETTRHQPAGEAAQPVAKPSQTVRSVRPKPEGVSRPAVASISSSNSDAHQRLELGNYAESYRRFQTMLQGLPEHERRRVLAQSQEAARSYERGDFREAAYRMQQAFNN